jgi:hypothetical protein
MEFAYMLIRFRLLVSVNLDLPFSIECFMLLWNSRHLDLPFSCLRWHGEFVGSSFSVVSERSTLRSRFDLASSLSTRRALLDLLY